MTAPSATVGKAGMSVMGAYAPIVITGIVLALLPLRYGDSRTMMGVIIGGLALAAYAVAWNVIFGSTGQLFLCIGALAGVGGYASVILGDRAGLPLVLSLAVAALISGATGGLLSWVAVSRSLGVIFTGIVTLAFSLSFHNVLLGRRDFTGGETGLRVDAGSETLLGELVAPYYVFLALVILYLLIYRMLQRSRVGWAFRALRDDEIAAELAGVDVKRYRVLAGTLGSLMLGLAGALYAHTEGFISPSTYGFGQVDVRVIVMLAFGGIGSLLGPVVGAASFTILEEWLVAFNEYRLIIYGTVIVALFLFFPRGVVPTVVGVWQRLRRRGSGRVRATASESLMPVEGSGGGRSEVPTPGAAVKSRR